MASEHGHPAAASAEALGSADEDIRLRLARRVLVAHGGTGDPWRDHWNLSENDSLLHRDAVRLILELRNEREASTRSAPIGSTDLVSGLNLASGLTGTKEDPAPTVPSPTSFSKTDTIYGDRSYSMTLEMRGPTERTAEALQRPAGEDREESTMQVNDEMVSRFLTWRLPDDFGPDCGITFAKFHPNGTTRYEPVGTNLLTAAQARAMLEHVLGSWQARAELRAEPSSRSARSDVPAGFGSQVSESHEEKP